MAEYQKIEYRIGKDGNTIETAIEGSGTRCTEITAGLEAALGQVKSRELLPEYYHDRQEGYENLTGDRTASIRQEE
ncbi:DUF2997 domain-containing protein [Oxynema aestuarii]|uniref:DUF2997 domain-containing protein n=1 Tax=Oxynema aestuarii AP17 TaxID=2064643 RepID=A0A6H1U4Z3_9CYAN|nr:DUF2997 domain-containing protein [Oxynema aestuarii]QIZ73220.1 DUF2997 domain-containing protein [Oxynema aestuarii AP17]